MYILCELTMLEQEITIMGGKTFPVNLSQLVCPQISNSRLLVRLKKSPANLLLFQEIYDKN